MIKSRYLLLILILLSIFSVVLYWRIPSNSGLGAISYLMFNVIFVGFLGIITCGLLFWKRKISIDLKSVFILFLSCVLIPVILGPVISVFIKVGLYSFYDSDYFVNKYINSLGVSIKSQGQSFKYAHCQIENYSAKYIIRVKNDSELIFALENVNGMSYDQLDYLPLDSLKKTFSYKSDVHFGRLGFPNPLGVFQVPKGEYEITVLSKSPFLLSIYDNKPLLTPEFILIDEKDYPKIYSDKFSQNEIDLGVQDIKAKSCNDTQIIRRLDNGDYFLNKYVYIPNAKINIYNKKYIDQELYLYNQWPGNSGLDESLLLNIVESSIEKPITNQNSTFYKTVVNKFTEQSLNVYLTVTKKEDPHRPPYLVATDYDNFVTQIKNKTNFSEDDLQYLNRTDSYFWVDKPIQMDGLFLYFNDKISPYNIKKVLEIMEVIEPSQIYIKDVELNK